MQTEILTKEVQGWGRGQNLILKNGELGLRNQKRLTNLVAPYCAIPRDYLSDTPLLRAMGFFGVSTWPMGCDTPSPFSERFPLGEHSRSGGAIPPPQKGYLSDTCAIPYENKANGCDTPLCDTISQGYCAIWGGISHWPAKLTKPKNRTNGTKEFSEQLEGITESLPSKTRVLRQIAP